MNLRSFGCNPAGHQQTRRSLRDGIRYRVHCRAHRLVPYRARIRYRGPCVCSLLCWCSFKQINVVISTSFLTVFYSVLCLAWLCYEAREDCNRCGSV